MFNFFKKTESLIIFLSLLITTLVSLIVGVSGHLITGQFWGFFILGFGVQFILFAVVNTILIRKDQIEGVQIVNEQLEAISKHTIRLSCAYCQISSVIPVSLNTENRFKCESCNQVNGVKMQFYATQITTPLKKIGFPLDDEI